MIYLALSFTNGLHMNVSLSLSTSLYELFHIPNEVIESAEVLSVEYD